MFLREKTIEHETILLSPMSFRFEDALEIHLCTNDIDGKLESQETWKIYGMKTLEINHYGLSASGPRPPFPILSPSLPLQKKIYLVAS